MNEHLNDQHNWAMRETREKALFRYTVALEHGNFDTITAIMRLAENDPVLEDMIMAVNKAHYRALATQHQLPASPWFTIPASVGSITSAHSIPTRHPRLGHAVTPRSMRVRLRYPSVGFVAAVVAIILFAATIYNIAVMSSKSAAGKIAMMTTSRSENSAALYLLLSPTTSPQLLAAFSGSIAEAPGQVAWSPDGTHIAFTSSPP